MGIYCFKISDHGVQHAVTTLHVISEADLVRIHAPSSSNKCIHPRSPHTHLESESENDSYENRNHSQRRNSRRSRTRMSESTVRCVYVRSSNLCVLLLPGNQHTKRLHEFVHEGQRIWLPVGIRLLANAVRSCCNTCHQSSWRLQLSATTLTSREISAFCGRWNDWLGPARSLSLTMIANQRSCKSVTQLAGTELQTPCMH